MRAIDLNFVHQQTFEAFILGKLFDVFVATGLLVQKLITWKCNNCKITSCKGLLQSRKVLVISFCPASIGRHIHHQYHLAIKISKVDFLAINVICLELVKVGVFAFGITV